MGFNEVELPGYYGLTPEQFKAELTKAGLKPTGALFGFDRYQKDIDGIIREAKLLGMKAVGCAWIPHVKLFTKADAEKGAAVFNAAGEKLRANGIRFYYHAHGYEFRPVKDANGNPNGTLFDYMATLMKPGVADFQIDVYWAYHGGERPESLIRRYKGRVLGLHLKDMAWGQENGIYTGGAPIANDCVHGKGQQNFKAILAAAQQANVPYLYIEDENLDAINQLPQSLTYLRGLK
jgi:sugar phosphate isomerase/epimerase